MIDLSRGILMSEFRLQQWMDFRRGPSFECKRKDGAVYIASGEIEGAVMQTHNLP